MKREDPRALVAGHVVGNLSRKEKDELAASALGDQDLFDQMMEAEPAKQALADPQFRRSLSLDLRERRLAEGVPFTERLRRFFVHPVVIPALTLALTAIIVVQIRRGALSPDSPIAQVAMPPGAGPVLTLAGILPTPQPGELGRLEQVRQSPPTNPAAGGAIGLDRSGDRPVYRAGEPLRVGFRLPQDANVMVIEERPDGTSVRLFPNLLQSSSAVRGNEQTIIPPPGQGQLPVTGPAGTHTIKVLVFPNTVDPMDFSRSWSEVSAQAKVLTKSYEVAP